MTTARPLLFLLVTLTSLFAHGAVGQAEQPPAENKSLDAALKPVGSKFYHDDFAGLTLEVPPNTVVMANDKVQELAEESRQIVEQRSKLAREAAKTGQRSRTLFRLHLEKSKQEGPGVLAGIAAWQEELKQEDQGVTPQRFLGNLRKALQQSSNLKFHDELFTKKIGDHTFTFQLAEFELKLPDGQVVSGVQEQHVVLLGDRALGFALTYNTVAEGEALRNIVWSLKLDEKVEERNE